MALRILKVRKYSGKAFSSEVLILMFLTRFILLLLTLNMKRKGRVVHVMVWMKALLKIEQEKENTGEKETLH